MLYDPKLSFDKPQYQLPKKSSPKWQRCDEVQGTSRPYWRRINHHWGISGIETQGEFYNQAKAVSNVVKSLQHIGIENNEFIIRIRIPDNPSQHREPSFI